MVERVSPKVRDATWDLLRGVGILAVVLLHVSSNRARNVAVEGSAFWWGLKAINLACAFAVPVFLLTSAVLWTESYRRRGHLLQFVSVRFVALVVPYLIWSLFYEWFDVWAGADLAYATPEVLQQHLLYGRSQYHLYFMVLLAQLVILVPLAAEIVRRTRANLLATVLAGLLLQGAIFWAQRTVLPLNAPGSVAMWHVAVWLPGVWWGLHPGWIADRRGRVAFAGAALAVLGGALSLGGNLELLRPGRADGVVLFWAAKAYALGIGILLLTALMGWRPASLASPAEWARRSLHWCGERSLQIYLVHPAVLVVLASPSVARRLPGGWANAALVYLGVVLGTAALAQLSTLLRLDGPLFWKWPPRRRKIKAPEPPPEAGTPEPVG